MAHQSRFAGYAGFVAAVSMAFTPAQAAETSIEGTMGFATAVHAQFKGEGSASPFNSSTYNSEAETAEWRRGRWGRRGWRRHRRGIRGGDVLAGVLILGGIAAIASAASNNERRERRRYEERRRYDERRYDDRRYDDRRDNPRASNGSGIDNAVSQCLAEIERDVRVDSVDGASRLASGWIVTGTLFNGSGFTCQIDNNGRISNIDYGGFSASNAVEGSDFAAAEGQLSDTTYADARAAVGGTGPATTVTTSRDEARPAYPGGPLPGEEFPE